MFPRVSEPALNDLLQQVHQLRAQVASINQLTHARERECGCHEAAPTEKPLRRVEGASVVMPCPCTREPCTRCEGRKKILVRMRGYATCPSCSNALIDSQVAAGDILRHGSPFFKRERVILRMAGSDDVRCQCPDCGHMWTQGSDSTVCRAGTGLAQREREELTLIDCAAAAQMLGISTQQWLDLALEQGLAGNHGYWRRGDVQAAFDAWVAGQPWQQVEVQAPPLPLPQVTVDDVQPAHRSRLHVHSYRQLHHARAWSAVLAREVEISGQACACGSQREVVRVPGRLFTRVVRIRPMKPGTYSGDRAA
jgi:hypothetical protein